MDKFEKANDIIKAAKTAAIVGHIRPDGDCVGSCVAMRIALLNMDYTSADVYLDGVVSSTFSYMPSISDVITEPPGENFSKKYDLMIILDCSDENRLGLYSGLRKYCEKVICFDHHENPTIKGDAVIADYTYASAGLLLYEYFTKYGIEITTEIATGLYTSIASDTGCFLFPNTSSLAHRATADLIDKGINLEQINYFNFRVYDPRNIETLVYVLKNIKLFANKQVASIHLPYNVIKRFNINNDFRHRFQKYVDDMNGVRASVCFTENERGVYHVSLRSHGEANVASVAESFGGGGHKNASGFQIKTNSFNNLLTKVVEKLKSALQEIG